MHYENPSERYLKISEKIMDSFLKIYGSETGYLESEGGCVS